MFSPYHPNKSRRWRTLFALLALFIALSTLAPAWATPQVATGSQQPAVSRSHSLLAARYSLLSPSDDPLPAPYVVTEGRFRYFAQTAHFLRGIFFSYWETHGATPVLGLPITEAYWEDGMVVQYLERARLEWHPEIGGEPRNQVLLTRLGAITSEARGLRFERLPAGQNTLTSVFFTETGHNLSNAFLTYWQRNGGLAVFGYPLSEEIVELSPTDGKPYTVQYFERNRFEWHPEHPPAFNVQLGLLGVEYARSVSISPLARVLLPGPVSSGDQDFSDSEELADLIETDLLPAVQALGRTPQFRWVPAFLVANNIPVEFSEIDEEGVAGAFITTRSRTRPYLIAIPESERGESEAALASIVAHEATHAYNVITGATPARLRCSIEEEVRAYMNGLAAWVIVKGDTALSDRYEPDTLDAAINRSLRNFNAGKEYLDFDFDVQEGRDFVLSLYGDDCGA
jgi:hypothetical protein